MHSTSNIDDGYLGSGVLFLKALKKYGKENFIRKVLCECSSFDDMLVKESEFVNREFCLREDTYNIIDGGYGCNGLKHSEETKQRMSIIAQGRTHTEETKLKMSTTKKGMVFSQDHREKIVKANTGKKRSDEVKARMSQSHIGQVPSNKGVPHSEATRAKMVEAHRRRKEAKALGEK